MTADELDKSILDWRDRLASASRNVVELSELPEFAVLNERLRLGRLAGRTADEARSVVAAMEELWQGVLWIGSAIDRADEARRHGPLGLFRAAAIAEAESILTGDSIELAAADTPVLGRSLLGGGAQARAKVSLERLLTTMTQAFDHARDTLSRLVSAQSAAVDAVAALRADIASLDDWPATDGLLNRLTAAEADAVADPVGLGEQISANLRPLVDAARSERARSASEIAAVTDALGEAGKVLARLAAAEAEAKDAVARASAKLIAPILPAPRAEVVELPGWLDRLRANAKAGKLQAVRVGVARWSEMADQCLIAYTAVTTEADRLLARREDLRGRFSALQAKQAAIAKAGADVSAAATLTEQIKPLLFGGPTPLPEAERLLADYESRLARPVAQLGR